MIRRVVTLGLVASLFLLVLAPASQAQAPPRGGLLSDIPVTGDLADGGTFEGVLSITDLAVENGELLVSGVLTGTATQDGVVTQITQTFTDVPASLLANGSGNSCQILFLDLGPIFLDLLGLTVDLSEIELDVRGERGPGNLLGNLLCAVAGLLDGGATGGLSALIGQITNLLG